MLLCKDNTSVSPACILCKFATGFVLAVTDRWKPYHEHRRCNCVIRICTIAGISSLGMRSLGVWGPVCGTSPSGGLPCTSAPFGACNQPNYLRTAHVAGSSACSLHRLHQLPGVKPPVGGLLAVPSRSCSTIYGCSKLRLQVCNSYKSGGPRALQTGSFGRSTAAECALGPDAHILLPAHGPLQVAALQVVVEDEAQTVRMAGALYHAAP